MTVVVAFVGGDGAVMASDSEASEGTQVRYDVEKIWTCGGLLCGYTGSGAVKDRVAHAMDEAVEGSFGGGAIIDRHAAANLLQQTLHPVLMQVYQSFVPAAPGQNFSMLAGAVLVAGRDEAGYWLLELDGNNTATFYTDSGFHTVGSGSAAAYVAHALMKGYDIASRDVATLRLVAYRTVDNCINSLGGRLGVGGHVQLWSSQDGAPFTKVVGDDLDAVANGVEQWVTIERESLDRVSGLLPSEEPLAVDRQESLIEMPPQVDERPS